MTDSDLEQFEEKDYPEMLEDMARRINPRRTGDITREGFGKVIDVAVLLRRGFQQGWQFIVVIQALFIFFGLSGQVSNALAALGIYISAFWLGVLAIGGIAFFFGLGLLLLLWGGSSRSRSLMMSKQDPNPRLDYEFYKSMAEWARGMEKRQKKVEEKLDEIREG